MAFLAILVTIIVIFAVGAFIKKVFSWVGVSVPSLAQIRGNRALVELRDKRVVICGASTGIGRELALEYAVLGARIVISSRSKDLLEEVAKDCRAAGAKEVFICATDLSTVEGCTKLIDSAKEHLGGIDTIVLNHVRAVFGSYLQMGLPDIRSLMDINLLSYMYLAHMALPLIRFAKGNLVVVSSVAGKIGTPFVAPYSAAKHALHGFFDALRLELDLTWGSDHGVGITACVLGSIDTASAKEVTAGHLEGLPRVSAKSTAQAIIRAGALRVRELYYPFLLTWPGVFLHNFIPRVVEQGVKSTVGKGSEGEAVRINR